jgi:hypothetical protein
VSTCYGCGLNDCECLPPLPAECWNIFVTLSYGEDDGPMVQVRVNVYDTDDLGDIEARSERAEETALNALRPFLNNRTHFIATTYLPQRTDLIPWAPGGPGEEA